MRLAPEEPAPGGRNGTSSPVRLVPSVPPRKRPPVALPLPLKCLDTQASSSSRATGASCDQSSRRCPRRVTRVPGRQARQRNDFAGRNELCRTTSFLDGPARAGDALCAPWDRAPKLRILLSTRFRCTRGRSDGAAPCARCGRPRLLPARSWAHLRPKSVRLRSWTWTTGRGRCGVLALQTAVWIADCMFGKGRCRTRRLARAMGQFPGTRLAVAEATDRRPWHESPLRIFARPADHNAMRRAATRWETSRR